MTSRRYSELSNASNMSLIDEGDENSTPVVGDNSTPRAKLVPMKKTRVSDSPLTSRQQNMAFKGDKNLEETFVEQSFLAAPLVDESEMQTLVKDITQQRVPFEDDKHLEATFVEPSFIAAPTTPSSVEPMPTSNIIQESVSFNENVDTSIHQSFFATPTSAKSSQNTPSLDITQKSVSFKADKHLEETFVEPSFFAKPANNMSAQQTENSANETFVNNENTDTSIHQSFFATPTSFRSSQNTPTTDKTPKSVSFKVEEASAETSVFSTPPVVKYLHQTPTTDLHQKSVSFNVGKDVDDDHVVKPSYFATPKPVSKKQPLEYTDETYFEDEKSFEQEAVTTTSSEAITGESPKRSDASVFDASMVSFLEEEMQVYAEEQCKCIRFESVIKEYNILREKFEAKPGSGNVNTTITNDASVDSKIDEEIFQLNEELVKVQMEVEDYKKAAEIAKKEAEDFQFVLDEEKRRAKNRIADLQKENFALSDELETLKLGGGDASVTDKLQEQLDQMNKKFSDETQSFKAEIDVLVNEKADLIKISAAKDDEINQHKISAEKEKTELQDELVRLNDQLLKATEEIEEYKAATENAQKEIGDLQAIVTKGKEFMNARIAEVNNQNDSMIQSLQAEIVILGNDKDELQKAFDEKCDEVNEIKSDAENKRAEFNTELSRLIAQLSKAVAEVREYETEANAVKNEVDELQTEIDSLNLRLIEAEKQKDIDIEILKADLINISAAKDDEINQHKIAAEKEKTELQDELARLNDQLLKATEEIEEYKTATENAQKEIGDLQAIVTKGKEILNARIAEVKNENDSLIQSLQAEIDIVVNEKAALINISAAKDDEINQHKIAAEKEKTELQDELVRLNDQLLKATEEIEEYKTATENAQKEIGDLQAIVTKGKEILNARIAEVKNENDSFIQSLQVEIDVLGNDKDELQKAFDEKCDEAKQLKINAENEKAEFDVELSRLIDQLSKTTADAEEYKTKTDAAKKEIDDLSAANEKLKIKISKLYDDLDEADAEKKESSELIFNLTTKLSKYTGEDGAEIRAGIDMGEVMSPRPPPSPDTSFKSVAEEPQPSSSSQLDNDDDEKDVTPTKSKGTPKRKQSFGAKIASPFRRGNKKDASQTAAKKEDNGTSCTTQ